MQNLKNLKIDTLIFDLDGTLIDTVDDLTDSVNYALNYFNYPVKTKDEIRLAVGFGVSKLFENVLPSGVSDKRFMECIEKFKEFYTNIEKSKTHPYEGIIELLKTLKEKNYKTGVVSNKFNIATKMNCKKFFDDLIDYAIGEDEANGIIRKPNPIGVYKVIEKLNSKIENCIYLGDSDVDIQTAKNANIPCISVLWGFKSKEFLIKSGGEIFVSKPGEILDII